MKGEKMKRKWNNIQELCECITEDDSLDSCAKYLKCICYAPIIGYRSWIFKYKGTLVALFDIGNSHYDFHTSITKLELLYILIRNYFERREL